ncbi:MAG: hypothetical protein AB7U63_01725 [Porticoccaceae bacterium]
MLPDIDNRINNLIKAVEKTIAPAIDPENGLAQEQAALVVGHLKMLNTQWDKAYLFERGSFDNMRSLASQLAAIADGGQQTQNAKDALTAALGGIPVELPLTPSGINKHTIAIGNLVDNLINACYVDGSAAFKAALSELVLNYGEKQATRERIWFNANGLDPDKAKLGSIDDMLVSDAYRV